MAKKICKRIVSTFVTALMIFQMAITVMPSTAIAAGESKAQNYSFTPYLAEGASIDGDSSFFVTGNVNGDSITITQSKTITFTVNFAAGWSYNSAYSNIFEDDKSNAGVLNSASLIKVSYNAVAGRTVPLSTFDDLAIYTTAKELPSLWINMAGDDSRLNMDDITKDRWFTANFTLTMGTKQYESGDYQGTGFVKARGNTSTKADHPPLSIKLDKKASWLDIPKTKKYAIITTYYDSSYVKNYIAYKSCIGLDGIGYTVKCEMVKVYFNDEYRDVYTLCERIAIESNKVDIADTDLLGAANINPATGETEINVTGGCILEANTSGKLGNDIAVSCPYNTVADEDVISFKDPDENIPQECLDYIEDLFQRLHDAVMGISGEDYHKYIDIDSWADFAIIEEVSKNCDGNLKTSCYFLKNPDSEIIEMTAPWDFDLAFGGSEEANDTGKNEKNDLTPGTTTDGFMIINSSNPWYKALFEKSEFRELVREKYTKYRYTLFEDMFRMIDEQSAYMYSTIGGSDREDNVEDLKDWLTDRLAWLDEQWLIEDDVIKIACVGDANSAKNDSYAEKLQTSLGDGYEVTGYGVANVGVRTYRTYTEYLKALSCDADYVIIMLGTYDGNSDNYSSINSYYKNMLTDLVEAFSAQNTEVYIATSPTVYSGREANGITPADVNSSITNLQRTVARSTGCGLIEISGATANHSEMFPGGVLANDQGDTLIAETVMQTIFSDVFADVTFTTAPGVKVTLGNLSATTDDSGKASFKVMPGEYAYTIAGVGYVPKQGTVKVESGDNSFTVTLEIDEEGIYEITNLALTATAFDNFSQGVGNITRYLSATDASGVTVTYTLGNFNDGDRNTLWQYDGRGETELVANDNELYYGLDYGASRYITKIVAYYAGNTSRPTADGYHVHYSIDGKEWSTLETAGTRNEDERSDTIILPEPIVARYVRVDITSGMGKYYPKLAEFETYGYIGVNMGYNTVGAQIRDNGLNYDLRFVMGISPDYVNKDLDEIQKIGALLIKKNDLGNDCLSLNYADGNTAVKSVEVKYISTYHYNSLGKYTVNVTIAGISDVNTEYVIRGYIILSDGSAVYTDMMTRSVKAGI